MQFHPYAEIFPLLTGDDFEKLKQDIESNGLQQPILLSSDGRIADGRNRYRACYELDIEPEYITHHGDDTSLLHRVISLNLHRRHLTAGQRAMVALEIKPMFEAQAQDNLRKSAQVTNDKLGRDTGLVNSSNPTITPIDSRQESAKAVGVGSQAVSRAETIAKTSPVLKQAVQAGEVSLNKAYEATKEPEIVTELEQSIHDNVWSKGKSVGDMLNELQKKKQKEATQASDYTYQATPKVKDCKNDMVLIEQQIENIMTAIKVGQIEQSHAGWFETRLSHLQTKLDYMIELLGEISNGNA